MRSPLLTTSVLASFAGFAISLTKALAMGSTFSLRRASTLCKYSALFHRGVLAQLLCTFLAASKTALTSSCVHAIAARSVRSTRSCKDVQYGQPSGEISMRTLHLEIFLESRRIYDWDSSVAGGLLPLSVDVVLVHTVLSNDLIIKACHSGSEHSTNQLCLSKRNMGHHHVEG